MAGGEELGAGQIPAVGVAGGEGEREGKHEGTSGYLWVVLGRLGMVGDELPTEGRAGGRRRTAGMGFRRAEEEKDWLGRCGGARGSCWCSWFGEEKSGGENSTATRAHGGINGGGKLLYARGEGLGRRFIGKRGDGEPLAPQSRREGEIRLAHGGFAAAAVTPACGAGSAQAPWRTGGTPVGES
jgi:hypothetical protein